MITIVNLIKILQSPLLIKEGEENVNSIISRLTENERKALIDLIRLLYFTGVVEDMIEIKFVD